MKKLLATALAVMTTVSLMACGGGNKGTEEQASGADTKGTSITVQVEEAWLPYYEAARERVLANNEGAKIDFVKIGSFGYN